MDVEIVDTGPDRYLKLENQSEERVFKAREPAAEFARKLLC
jgi:hypothetical protein